MTDGFETDGFETDRDPARIDRDAVWRLLSTEAYWGRWRAREDLETQLDNAWRIVGAYETATGRTVGFARAVSDGVSFAYLADVMVDPAVRGRGLGQRIVAGMVEEPPGPQLRWALATSDAHGLYARYGFAPADATWMVRPAPPERR